MSSLLIEWGIYRYVVGVFGELVALGILFSIVVVVGTVGHNRYGEQVIEVVDLVLASIPGVGTVYKSFRRMGDVMADGDAENFRAVVLVECLGDETYVLGFETSRPRTPWGRRPATKRW